jgi:hypothetical protein
MAKRGKRVVLRCLRHDMRIASASIMHELIVPGCRRAELTIGLAADDGLRRLLHGAASTLYREITPGHKPLGASAANPTVVKFLTDGMAI